MKGIWTTRLISFVLGMVCVCGVAFAGMYLYLKFGNLPVAAADPAFPFEAQVVHVPLGARIERDLQSSPIPSNAANLLAGAEVYAKECASCHGRPGADVAFAQWMYPRAPQLWKKHKNGVVGVSDDEAGETYWKVKNGIRLTGMPAYQHILSDTQMWQMSLLLKNADQAQSTEVTAALAGLPKKP